MRRAFSAIELTIVICVLAICSAIAMPATTRLLDRIRVRSAVTEIEALFGAARHIAIARSYPATVDIDTLGEMMSVIVNGDTARKGLLGSEHSVEIGTNRSSMSYSPTGVGYGAANLSIVVRRGVAVDTVVVSRLGRVRH